LPCHSFPDCPPATGLKQEGVVQVVTKSSLGSVPSRPRGRRPITTHPQNRRNPMTRAPPLTADPQCLAPDPWPLTPRKKRPVRPRWQRDTSPARPRPGGRSARPVARPFHCTAGQGSERGVDMPNHGVGWEEAPPCSRNAEKAGRLAPPQPTCCELSFGEKRAKRKETCPPRGIQPRRAIKRDSCPYCLSL
jgi:hypothetical protein